MVFPVKDPPRHRLHLGLEHVGEDGKVQLLAERPEVAEEGVRTPLGGGGVEGEAHPAVGPVPARVQGAGEGDLFFRGEG